MYCLIFILFVDSILCDVQPGAKIVGGRDVSITDYPWQLALELYNQQFCGATIIHPNWALTAAHCFSDMDINMVRPLIKLRAGSTQRQKGGSLHSVINIVQRNYSDITNDEDFALVKVYPPFRLGAQGIQKINIATQEPTLGSILTVSGWGHTMSEGDFARNLQAVDVKYVGRDKCRAIYGSTINKRMLCAGIDAGGKDSCQGDSGGPMVDFKKKILHGVVSFGTGCGEPNIPGVYSNPSDPAVYRWIQNTIKA